MGAAGRALRLLPLLALVVLGAPIAEGKKKGGKPRNVFPANPPGTSRHRVRLGEQTPAGPTGEQEAERESQYPPDWHETMECRKEPAMRELLQAIRQDLEPWMFKERPPITREMHELENLPQAMRWATTAIHRFVFIGGVAYHALGHNMSALERDGPQEWYEVFARLSKKGNIPDMEFLIHNSDVGGVKRGTFVPGTDMPFPLFSYCKYEEDHDITWPHSHWLQYGFEKKVFSNRAILDLHWAQKKEVAFWRGSITTGGGETASDIYGRERQYEGQPAPRKFFLRLAEEPEAQGVLDIRNHSIDYVPMEKHNAYKYLVDIDGFGCSTRLQQILGMNSVPLKMASRLRQYFTPLLQPYKHYIPFWHTGNDDLINITKYLRRNDDLARNVAEAAYNFAQEHLREPHVLCYWEMLLQEYAKLLAFKPKLSDYPHIRPVSDMLSPDGDANGVVCKGPNERRPFICKEKLTETLGIDLSDLPPEGQGSAESPAEGAAVAPAQAPAESMTEGPAERPAEGPAEAPGEGATVDWADQWEARGLDAPPAPYPPYPPAPPTSPNVPPPAPPRFRHAWSRRHGAE